VWTIIILWNKILGKVNWLIRVLSVANLPNFHLTIPGCWQAIHLKSCHQEKRSWRIHKKQLLILSYNTKNLHRCNKYTLNNTKQTIEMTWIGVLQNYILSHTKLGLFPYRGDNNNSCVQNINLSMLLYHSQ
jgi:hypothetical protein